MKLSRIQRQTLAKLQQVRRNRGAAIPADWPFWDRYGPATIRALLQKGALIKRGGQIDVVGHRESLHP